ncbi:hypothetical protein K6U70_13025 [Vibrio vulnificus]|uniref:hypothetical protein n=1 Tax=Vibrio vulnificus TaxID=672 RepID=UPI001EEC2925|nr:hypothetical protein [Vibrio vulnificus]MCG6273046.1 hypothetical protein [Vibrio vulnificus]
MDFKVANYCDFERISQLHANSLKSHYGGILSEQYLTHEVSAEDNGCEGIGLGWQ